MTTKSGLDGTAGDGLKAGQCARQNVVTSRVIPTVWLVLDGSGSMVETLGDTSRWNALRAALMDPTDGVVKSLEHEVKWGMVIYDGLTPGDIQQPLPDGGVAMFSMPPATTCPRLVTVEPALDNFMPLDMNYASTPLGGSTPTDQALNAVIGHLPDQTGQVLDGRIYPTIVVLATDGAPNNFCTTDFTMIDAAPAVITAVSTLASMNTKTYVISLAGGDAMLTQHLEQVATAGMTGMPPFVPTNKAELVQVFKDIIGPAAACDVVLRGSVKPGIECMGSIKVNGVPLACNDPNGWMLKDKSTISITGTACDEYRNNLTAVLEADFPCEAIDLN
ncbi:MAG TPA: vWA domain-containing protein [Polyangiales bacterium]|nr:vWA domain-containing protein [Polyangiales bacterium]